MGKVRLGKYDNSWYRPGRSFAWRAAWMVLGAPVVRCGWMPFSGLRVALLRLFGAKIGRGVVVKPGVEVKYPWHLVVGDDTWIGENAWIDCLTTVRIGSNACVSQGAYLCTGNHDWTDPGFGLMIAPVQVGEAAWVGAKAILMPGCMLGEGAVAGAGSVVRGIVPDWEIHAGNPAVFLRRRGVRGDGDGVSEGVSEHRETV